MPAAIQKNELIAAKRQCDLIVYADGALTLAPRGTDFVALGILFVSDGSNVPHFKAGTGTCVNKRKPVAYTGDTVESADTVDDNITMTAHGLETGDGPFTSDEVMGSIAIGDPFYAIKDNADEIGIAATLADAYAGTREALTGSETGATIAGETPGLIYRGIDGFFTYTFTQSETNVDLSELTVLIDGTDYARSNNGGAYTTAAMDASISDIWGITSGDGHTNQQKLNLAARNAAAPFSKTGDDYVYRKLDDSGDSHSATVTPAGRSDVDIIDPD